MKIVIVDYGMGNIPSIVSALKYIGYIDIIVSDSKDELEDAEKLILPGVGNFSQAIKIIRQKQLDTVLSNLVLKKKKPILGICLGMQLLGESSTEGGLNKGLGFVKGKVEMIPNREFKVPHVGYNQVSTSSNSRLYESIKSDSDFYFTHSFRMTSDSNIGQSCCRYSGDFVASFEVDNIAGTQFHPEISQQNGLKLLQNFIERF